MEEDELEPLSKQRFGGSGDKNKKNFDMANFISKKKADFLNQPFFSGNAYRYFISFCIGLVPPPAPLALPALDLYN